MTWEQVRDYHRQHGDDYGSELSRVKKYTAILELAPTDHRTLLDAGCGQGKFKAWQPDTCTYTGLDLVDGQNVLDHETTYDVVVANGLLYKIPVAEGRELLDHLWSLAREALVFTALRIGEEDETVWPPQLALDFAAARTHKFIVKADYLPHDFAVAMYR